ncbi:hypothetical protein [Dysgonomonas sp. ZJ709]|uniref:hypothetical protein n=1 Tax=Dysgonomonas sp. ZJ709 TaxID=2709797 RepID=UPI0013EBD0AE|nr:hypothetical protein [Dysgonomonas sp. ZJ709]
MKFNKSFILIIVVIWSIIIFFIVKTIKDDKEKTEAKIEFYPLFDKNTVVNSIVRNKEVEKGFYKGTVYLDLKDKTRIRFSGNLSVNYMYRSPCFDTFVQRGDLISKTAGTDTFYVYRNNQEYYFVLGQTINEDKRK